MEEKSVWQRIAGLVGGRSERALKELPTQTRRCPAGHPMAVDWSDCPYCRAERNAGEAAQVEPPPTGPTSGVSEPAADIALTRIRGETQMSGRPVVGIVFTFTWTRVGQLFPVYAGRNYGGTAPTTREGQRTEILLTEDPTLSGTHFLILYQQDTGQYRIADENSSNGTFINGEPIDARGTELPDDAQILAGKTLFIFKKVCPPTSQVELRPKSGQPG
jgi:hypothetical protein